MIFLSQPLEESAPVSFVLTDAKKPVRGEIQDGIPDLKKLLRLARCIMSVPRELPRVSGQADWYRVLQLGFRLQLPDELLVRWCRYRVGVFRADLQDDRVLLMDFHPRKLDQFAVFRDNAFLGDDGLERSAAKITDDPEKTISYQCRVMAYETAQTVNWDFSAVTGALGTGTGKMLLGIGTSSKYKLRIKSLLQVSFVHQKFGELQLELPAEVRDVR